MKVKFKFGIKSFSGNAENMNFANYKSRGVTIGRVIPEKRIITDNNVSMGEKMKKISEVYNATSDAYKKDLTGYTLRLYNTKGYQEGIAGNKFSTFVKMLWNASKDPENPLDLLALSVDDLQVDAYTQISSVKVAVENGYLPKVLNYECYNSAII